MRTHLLQQTLFAFLFLGLSFPALADPPANADPQARVGRVSLLDGTVSSHTADQTDWSPATLNYPVISGNSFWTEPNARAEIQVGSSALRLDNATQVDVNELDDQAMRVEVTQGTVNLHVGNLTDGVTYQVMTPNEAVNILQPGTYRISAGTNGAPDLVAVLKGQAQINDNTSSVTIGAGETASNPPGDMTAIQVQETVPVAFDNWSLARDNYEEPRKVVQYVSPEMTGYEDLDSYGTWQQMPDYGQVWIPANMPTDWAPYHVGHWAWVSPWGWTWIDAAPWGFAPYHYGRWARANNVWFWAPGAIVHRPVYAPALVAFVGGSGWNISVGIGSRPVGWFPLAPNEVYRPAYRVSDRYIHNVNVTNVHNVTRITNNYYKGTPNAQPQNFANRRFATVVPAKDFTSSRRVDRAAIKVSPDQLAKAPVTPSAAPHAQDQHHLLSERHFTPAPEAHPVAPTAPQAPVAPNVQGQRHQPQPEQLNNRAANNDHNERTAAPGPSIQPRAIPHTPFEQQQQQETHQLAAMPVQHSNHPAAQARMQPERQPAPQIQQQPQRHEISVQRPEQKLPLAPSHEGWVRRAPQEQPHAAPQPHAQPAEQHQGGHPEGGNGHEHP